MGNLVDLLGAPILLLPEPYIDPPESQLRQAIQAAGLCPPKQIFLDGEIHRFAAQDKPHDDSGWYVAYGDGVPAGAFGCWASGEPHRWVANMGRDLTPIELAGASRRAKQAQEARRQATEARHAKAKETAADLFMRLAPAPADHPYLTAKQVPPGPCKVTEDGRLVVPMYRDASLTSLQFVGPDGEKRFLAGGAVAGARLDLPAPPSPKPRPIFLAEGYATAATIAAQTQAPTYAAFSANNLEAVALQLRAANPQADLCIVADNDASGTGEKYAAKAAAAAQGRFVLVPTQGQDANDYHLSGGDLRRLLIPPVVPTWFDDANTYLDQPAPIRWLIKRWLPREALVMVHGPSGGGKTFAVLDMALTLAAGLPEWSGCTARPCTVAYLAGEGHHGIRARVAAWRQAHDLAPVNCFVSRSGTNLNEPDSLHAAMDQLAALPEAPGLIIVDTLHRFLGGDENSAQDTKLMLDALALMQRQFRAAVLLVHHTGVSEDAQHRARGSSAWKGALDVEISVQPSSPTKPLQLIQRKMKDAEVAEPLCFKLAPREIAGWVDEDGAPVTSAILERAEAPVAAPKQSPLAGHRKTFERAWWASGAELDTEGRPYVARAAYRSFLVDHDGVVHVSAEKYLQPGNPRGVIQPLLQSDSLAWTGAGWVVADGVWASALKLQKAGAK